MGSPITHHPCTHTGDPLVNHPGMGSPITHDPARTMARVPHTATSRPQRPVQSALKAGAPVNSTGRGLEETPSTDAGGALGPQASTAAANEAHNTKRM